MNDKERRKEKMDALKYLIAKSRMCKTATCSTCPLSLNDTIACESVERNMPHEAVRIVEDWEREHPIKTNRQKYEEIFGTTFGAHQEATGMPCPARSQEYCNTHRCEECRKWWEDEYREPNE